MAGREGLIDTAVKTSRSGYLQSCLSEALRGSKGWPTTIPLEMMKVALFNFCMVMTVSIRRRRIFCLGRKNYVFSPRIMWIVVRLHKDAIGRNDVVELAKDVTSTEGV